jgi:hypothetical protein
MLGAAPCGLERTELRGRKGEQTKMGSKEVVSFGRAVLTNITVEELESRLEMQLIAMPAAENCTGEGSCLGQCNPYVNCCKGGGCQGKE